MGTNFNKVICLFFLCTINLLIAQNNIKANLKYKVEVLPDFVEDIKKMDDKKEQIHMQKILSEIYDIKLTLKLDDDGSYFAEDAKMMVDRSQYETVFHNIAMAYADVSGSYYVDNNKKSLLKETESLGEKMLVVLNYKQYSWEIEKGFTKEIMGYVCHKATCQKKVIFKGKISYQKIEAWFTYDIKYSYGPKDYMGLPGIILEVNEGLTTLSCVAIVWDEDIIVQKPNKNLKTVTEGEFNSLLQSSMELYPR